MEEWLELSQADSEANAEPDAVVWLQQLPDDAAEEELGPLQSRILSLES